MSLEAKKEGTLRILGNGLIILGLILTAIQDLLTFNCSIIPYIIVFSIGAWLCLFVLAKFEVEIVVDYFLHYLILLVLFTAGLIIIGLNACIASKLKLDFIFRIISLVLIMVCWHYSLSIYKKEKIISILTLIGYLIITLIFRLEEIWSLISLFLICGGFVIILGAEWIMKRKQMLRYI